MGFFAPLYIAGLLGLSLPIVFHLIRRTPRGQQVFSSLMFLKPSPPTLTRRSRLDNILLLILRALILALLAFAFARPFLREAADLAFEGAQGRRVAILVDTSASMQREGVWRRAVEEVNRVLDEADPADQVALFTFDASVKTLVDFESLKTVLEHEKRLALVREKIKEVKPAWRSTDLASALIATADSLDAVNDAKADEIDAPLQLVLISDLQEGSELEALQGYEWPKGVKVELASVFPDKPTNAAFLQVGN